MIGRCVRRAQESLGTGTRGGKVCSDIKLTPTDGLTRWAEAARLLCSLSERHISKTMHHPANAGNKCAKNKGIIGGVGTLQLTHETPWKPVGGGSHIL